MRSVGLAVCLVLSSTLTVLSFVEAQDSPAQPKKLSVPVPVEASTSTLPVQVPNYLNEKEGWAVIDTRTGGIPVTASSKTGLWRLTLSAKARLTAYVQKPGGLTVQVLAVQTGENTFTDVSVIYGYEGRALQFALKDGNKWYLSKSAIGPEDQPSLENNVILFPDKLDEANRTVVLVARTVTADGITKEVRFPLN
jgi:hypothetical protein